MKNKTIKNYQKAGGILYYIGPGTFSNEHEVLLFFIQNSTIRLIELGTSGFIFECQYKGEPSKNPFTSFRYDQWGKKVTKIIIKLAIVCTNIDMTTMTDEELEILHESIEFDFTGYINSINGITKITQTSRCILDIDFENEVNQFKNVVSATNAFLQSISPTILASGFENTYYEPNSLLYHFRTKTTGEDRKAFDRIITAAQERFQNLGTTIGFIAMESVSIDENYNTITDLVHNIYTEANDLQVRKNFLALAVFNILLLAELGFIHGDHHLSNFLIGDHESYCGYFYTENDYTMSWSENKSCCFVDFGRSFSFDMLKKPVEIAKIEYLLQKIQFFKTTQTDKLKILKECLKIIYDFGYFVKGMFIKFNQDSSNYNWILSIDEDIAIYVQNLFIARERAQQKTFSELEQFIQSVHELQDSGQLQVSKDWSPNFISNVLDLFNKDFDRRMNEERLMSIEDTRNRQRIEEEKESDKIQKTNLLIRQIGVSSVLAAFVALFVSWINHRGGNKKLIGGGKKEEFEVKINLIIEAFITYTNGLVSISNLPKKIAKIKQKIQSKLKSKVSTINYRDLYSEPTFAPTNIGLQNLVPAYGGKYKTRKNKKRKTRKNKNKNKK
jgi:hypothetical protein